MKNTFFVVTAALAAGILAALLSGCDGSGVPEVAGGDAGRSDAVKSDARAGDAGTTCAVPESRRHVAGVGTTPRGGYRLLANAVVCTISPTSTFTQPTDCNAPVDGFEAASVTNNAFCCVKVVPTSYPGVVYASGVTCEGVDSLVPGNVALCTVDGVFAGWSC